MFLSLYKVQKQMLDFTPTEKPELDRRGKDIIDYGADKNGISDSSTALLSDINDGTDMVYIPKGVYLVNQNVTVPDTVKLVFAKNARLKIANGKTLTINGAIEAHSSDWIFDVSLGGNVSGNFKVREIYPQWFGAVGDGSNDDTTEMQTALNASVGKTCLIPDGVYKVTLTLSVPIGVNLVISQNATIIAGASMQSVLQYPLSTQFRNGFLEGGTIDCNALANIGVELRNFAHFTVQDMSIKNFQQTGLKLGDTSAPLTSYEGMVTNLKIYRDSGKGVVVSGSMSIWIAYGGDHKLFDCILQGAETGIRLDGSGNHLTHVHCWNYVAGTGWMVTGFDDNGSANIYNSCYADTVQHYGWRIRGNQPVTINACRVFNNSTDGVDNDGSNSTKQYTGVYFDNALPTASIIGLYTFGTDNTHRIWKDIDVVGGGNLNQCTIIGSMNTNVINTTQQRLGVLAAVQTPNAFFSNGAAASSARGFTVGTNGNNRWRAGTDSTAESGSNAGGDFVLNQYADNGSFLREAMRIQRSTGLTSLLNGIFQVKGTWDIPFRMSNHRLWVDSTGDLRIKNGDPTSDTDGTVVGTQS